MPPKVTAEPKEEVRHQDDVEKLVYDDGQLFSGAYDGTVKKWGPQLDHMCEWRAHAQLPVLGMASAGASRTLFTSSFDGEIKEWDADNGNFRQMFVMVDDVCEEPTEVKSLACVGGYLLAGNNMGVILRFKPNFVRDRHRLTYTEIWCLTTPPDDPDTVFTSRDNTVLVSDIATELSREEYTDTLSVKGSFDGRSPVVVGKSFVACVDRNGMKAKVYRNDGKKYPSVGLFEGHDMIINAVALDESGGHLVTAGWDGRVKQWDIETQKEIQQVELGNYVNALAIADSSTVFAAGKGGMVVRINF